jgi:PPOX class probable F420-dependent enzyme
MLDLTTDFGKRLKGRLEQDELIWFTSVSPKGRPASNPVWFYWDGQTIFVYSQPSSFRVRNLKRNPNVSLHFDGADAAGDGVYIVEGVASMQPGNQSIPDGYWKKYDKYLPENSLTRESMLQGYSVAIRVKPTKARGE